MKTTILWILTLITFGIQAQSVEYYYSAKIIDVYDGDTVTALVDLGFDVLTVQKLRLAEIDTPEVRGAERPQGLEVKQIVLDLILEKTLIIQTIKDKQGKFGRYLARIFVDIDGDGDLDNLNDWLVENGHAERYE